MSYLLPIEIAPLVGLVLIGWLAWALMGSLAKRLTRIGTGETAGSGATAASPFIELDVKPVSEGDEVRYAYHTADDKYIALVENRLKKARLDIEAGSEEELRSKVADTFRAWAVVGRKKPGR